MSMIQDLEQILETVLRTDPSFRRVARQDIDNCVKDARNEALSNSKDRFLLAVMRLLALARNGHTRLIPNDAISVLPLRFVTIGNAMHLLWAAPGITESIGGELVAVNDFPINRIEKAAEEYLAGSRQRKRVIGPILLVWPEALERLGFSSNNKITRYQVKDEAGQVNELRVNHSSTIPAAACYPRNEHGKSDAAWVPECLTEFKGFPGHGLVLVLPSFLDPGEAKLPHAISSAAERIKSGSDAPLLIDIRGNTGGDFLQTLPLIDAISTSAEDRRIAVLVDKFTFSAAIVFVAILKHRLGRRLEVIGEEVGDDLTFFAEGGLLDLPNSGAVVRYSSAFHDWAAGRTDPSTPIEIANQIVAVGELNLDQRWVERPAGPKTQDLLYLSVLESLAI